MHFTSSTSEGADAVIVHPVGEVDRDNADDLVTALTGAVDKAGPGGAVEVDLAGVPFLDSSGVGALLTGRQHASRRAVHFRVRDPQPSVHRVLEITNVWLLLSRA